MSEARAAIETMVRVHGTNATEDMVVAVAREIEKAHEEKAGPYAIASPADRQSWEEPETPRPSVDMRDVLDVRTLEAVVELVNGMEHFGEHLIHQGDLLATLTGSIAKLKEPRAADSSGLARLRVVMLGELPDEMGDEFSGEVGVILIGDVEEVRKAAGVLLNDVVLVPADQFTCASTEKKP